MSLSTIQKELNAPKNQNNTFGKYKYRSCEDILQAVKPHLSDNETIVISDDLVMIGDRYYVKATANFCVDDKTVQSVNAFARECLSKKGMDDAQLTGSVSSYARKYALNGLLLIDDNKDADYTPPAKPTEADKGWIDAIKSGTSKLEDISDAGYRATIKGFLP